MDFGGALASLSPALRREKPTPRARCPTVAYEGQYWSGPIMSPGRPVCPFFAGFLAIIFDLSRSYTESTALFSSRT